MEAKKTNPHADHRQRMRSLVRARGFDGMAEHNVLEFLLFYAIPRKDTNELAHRLIEQFGSLSKVLEASPERLMRVEGVGESTALLLSAVFALHCRLSRGDDDREKVYLETAEDMIRFLRARFQGVRKETAFLLCLDAGGKLISCRKLGEGSAESVIVDKRAVMETALHCNASLVVLAHNHPNGMAAPSREDLILTEACASMLRTVGIRMADHIIEGGGEYLSLASVSKFHRFFL
ncbi:MAG: DNA repair protein RadC [Clostridia bacterium]|nr:DNA repair protein RadC [Clostridia bacterium]